MGRGGGGGRRGWETDGLENGVMLGGIKDDNFRDDGEVGGGGGGGGWRPSPPVDFLPENFDGSNGRVASTPSAVRMRGIECNGKTAVIEGIL